MLFLRIPYMHIMKYYHMYPQFLSSTFSHVPPPMHFTNRFMFLFLLLVYLALPIWSWAAGPCTGAWETYSGHILKTEWLSLPQQLSTANHFSVRGSPWRSSTHLWHDFGYVSLCYCCAGNYSYCEFMSVIATSCAEDNILHHSLLSFDS